MVKWWLIGGFQLGKSSINGPFSTVNNHRCCASSARSAGEVDPPLHPEISRDSPDMFQGQSEKISGFFRQFLFCQIHWVGLRENRSRKPMGFYHQIGFSCKFSHHPILWQIEKKQVAAGYLLHPADGCWSSIFNVLKSYDLIRLGCHVRVM